MDWRRFGAVLPVLGASPGVGASVVAAALADELQLAGRSVLLGDAADPSRSGLAAAAPTEGPVSAGPHPSVGIRRSWRGRALLARLWTDLPIITPGMVPAPNFWLPEQRRCDVTVVDIGHDAWKLAANPLIGAGLWLRPGSPPPRPLLVCRETEPGGAQAEQVLARMQVFVDLGLVAPAAQLVIVGTRKRRIAMISAAGRRVAALIDDAVFVPREDKIAMRGVTAHPVPPRVRAALRGLLVRWGLLGGRGEQP